MSRSVRSVWSVVISRVCVEETLTGHAEVFSLLRLVAALRTRRRLAFLLLEHFASSVLITEAGLGGNKTKNTLLES